MYKKLGGDERWMEGFVENRWSDSPCLNTKRRQWRSTEPSRPNPKSVCLHVNICSSTPLLPYRMRQPTVLNPIMGGGDAVWMPIVPSARQDISRRTRAQCPRSKVQSLQKQPRIQVAPSKCRDAGMQGCRDCARSLLPRGNMCDLHIVGISVRDLPPVTSGSNDLNLRDWIAHMVAFTRAVYGLENAQRRF